MDTRGVTVETSLKGGMRCAFNAVALLLGVVALLQLTSFLRSLLHQLIEVGRAKAVRCAVRLLYSAPTCVCLVSDWYSSLRQR